jgi:predicted acyltransferase
MSSSQPTVDRTDPIEPITAAPLPTRTSRGARRASLDVLRGGLLAFMLFTPPYRFEGTYPLLAHADWLGWSLSDLIFPLFLFTSGGSLGYLLRRGMTGKQANRLTRRLIALIVLGLFYNAIGPGFDLATLRFTGVLQLIGVSGALGAVAVTILDRIVPDRPVLGVAVTLGVTWVAYAVVMGIADCWQTTVGCSPFHGIDVRLLGEGHVYRAGAGYDPEGIVVMIAATWIVLVGYLATLALRDVAGRDLVVRSAWVVGAGVVAFVLALVLDPVSPISKRVMSPTFLLLAAGIGLVLYGLLAAALDTEARQRWVGTTRGVLAWPFTTLGWNALVVYLGERVAVVAATQTTVAGDPAYQWFLDTLAPTYGDRAGLLLGLALVALLLSITGVMRGLKWHIAL